MIESRHIEEADNLFYFRDDVADFFWASAQRFVQKISGDTGALQPPNKALQQTGG